MLHDEFRDLLRDVGSLILRLGMAIPLISLHGWGKWVNFGKRVGEFPDPLGVGTELSLSLVIFAEVGCAVLLIVGLATRFAGVVIAGLFAIIVFVIDAGKPWSEVELAWLYGVAALTVTCVGPGRVSLDAVLQFVSGD